MVHASLILRSLRLTLFTKADCGLCVTAKEAVQNFRKSNSSARYSEVDIMGTGNEKWHDAYFGYKVFDVPVLHLEKEDSPKILKLMHRFTKEEIETKSKEL
ncbi:hypothetical protein H072_6877 [Dactylellina haptotyla CBS 200.50]|uniref:Glutaredoxin-like protein n=1 Tax=Dactylellina haptotyla (strain CBS 200.50) TaxID=1284197 RepID=S8AE50_DACHA|nr:hypothetical protein H072_6877 [Dactylellina haptotyla CBS 200.50]